MLKRVVRLVRLVLVDAADVFFRRAPDVGVHALHVGVRVVAHDVLLPPHERGCARDVQRQLHGVQEKFVFSIRAVVRVVLDGDADLGFAHAVEERERRAHEERAGVEEAAVVADRDARQDHERLGVHLGVHARVFLAIFKPLLHGELAVHVKLALLHVVVVRDDLALVPGFALQLADVVLVQNHLRAKGVVRVEKLRAVAASLDPDHVPARMPRHEAGDVVHLLVHDHPAVLGGGVLLHLRGGVLAGHITGARGERRDAVLGGRGRDGGVPRRHRELSPRTRGVVPPRRASRMADAERGRKRGRRETRNALPGRVRRRKRRLSRCGATARTREFLAAAPVPSASTTARTGRDISRAENELEAQRAAARPDQNGTSRLFVGWQNLLILAFFRD